MSDLDLLKLPKVLSEAVEVIENSRTKLQYEHRMSIFRKLVRIFESDAPDEEKLAAIFADFEVFCVCFIRLDDQKPMFPAFWQSEVQEIIEEHRENLFIECRKIGKSALLSAYVVWRMVNRTGERAIIFAPTTQQLYVMEDVYKAIKRNRFLMEKFVGKAGTFGKEHIVFGANEAEVKSSNLALSQEADTKRGEKGTLIIVDEIELVYEDIRTFVIDDMLADAYTEKKMILVGTPKDVANPKLQDEWRLAQDDPNIGTHHIDMWEGVDQGCIAREWVSMRFRRLRIPCPWGLYRGSCGRRDNSNEKFQCVTEPKHWEGWECSEICLQNESFVAENMGEFPIFADAFIPKPFLVTSGKDDFYWEVGAEAGAKYVIGVDYGLLVNPTQIVVFKMMADELKLVYWREMPAIEPGEEAKSGTRSYDPVVAAVQDTYWRFAGTDTKSVKWLFVDATQPGLQVTHDLTKGPHKVPASKIWSNETAEKRDIKGVWFTGQYKDMMMQNWKQLVLNGKVGVPNKEPFWGKYLYEHESIKVEPAGGGTNNYLKYQPKRGATNDLVIALALGALILSDEVKKSGPFTGFVHISDRPRSFRRSMYNQPVLSEEIEYGGLFQS
jgi:hypothetical protein